MNSLKGLLEDSCLSAGRGQLMDGPALKVIHGTDMFDRLLHILTGVDDAHRTGERSDPAFALAVLLIEVARSDDRVEDCEQGIIERALALRFGLERSEVTRLIKAAEEGAIQATDLFHFTRIVVKNFSPEERIGVIEMLWEVAYSDGVLTGDQDALIRRVAGLIYVSDRERAEARRRVMQRTSGSIGS
jgi:uncharacterized tellurite resistance protein B-like protein